VRITFYYYMGGGGGLSNLTILLRTMARQHPDDSIEVVTSPSTTFAGLHGVPNIRVRRVSVTGVQELDRLLLGVRILPRLLCTERADVLWSVNLGPYIRTKVPAVLSVNNAYQIYPWRMSRYHPGSRGRVALLRWFFRRSLRLADSVIVQTPIMADYVRAINGAPTKIHVAAKAVERDGDIPNQPLPEALVRMLEAGLGRGAFTCLYVSTWMPHKNHITLLRAFSALAQGNNPVRLVLTVTEQEIRASGCSTSAALLESGHVIATGWVEKPFLRALYEACAACLMPSHLESLSSAHLEAMQWGRPQIVADLPYAHDLCGPAALYAPVDDPNAWAREIERLRKDERLQRELVSAGFTQMKQFPVSWTEAAETVHRVLESAARSSP
jgi:glycosyltransferase involved in cell wall biosynthesis